MFGDGLHCGCAGCFVREGDGRKVGVDGAVYVGDGPRCASVLEVFDDAFRFLGRCSGLAHSLVFTHSGGVFALHTAPLLGEGSYCCVVAEDLRGSGDPVVLHFAQGLRFLLPGAGVEVGLLVERVHRFRAGHPVVFLAVFGDELITSGLDLGAP